MANSRTLPRRSAGTISPLLALYVCWGASVPAMKLMVNTAPPLGSAARSFSSGVWSSVIEINLAPPLARAHARLGLAVTRGLLLDLLATRDVAGVDAAMGAFIDVYTEWLTRRRGSA